MEYSVYKRKYEIEDKHWWFIGQSNFVYSFCKDIVKDDKNILILDVGCGTGNLLRILGNFGLSFGIDVSDIAISYCKKRNLQRISQCTITEIPFKKNSFDLITALGVLNQQKVIDDSKAISEIFRVLKKNGTVLFLEPAYKFLFSYHDIFEHTVRRYTINCLREKIKNAGFNILKVSYINMSILPPAIIVRNIKEILALNGEPITSDLWLPPQIINKFLIHILSLETKLWKKFSLPFGLTASIVAKKDENNLN